MSTHLPPETLNEWAAALADELGMDVADIPITLILNLARDAANGVARPAAPLSTFVVGLAAGRAGGTPEQVQALAAKVVAMAEEWGNR